jgi:hypothetical protein
MGMLKIRGDRIFPSVRHMPFCRFHERPGANDIPYLIARIGQQARLIVIPTAMRSNGERIWEGFIIERPSDALAVQAQVNGNGSIPGEDNR